MAGPQDVINNRVAEIEGYIGKTNAELMAQVKAILEPEGVANNAMRTEANDSYYKNIQANGNTIQDKQIAKQYVNESSQADIAKLKQQHEEGNISKVEMENRLKQINQMAKANLAIIDQMVESKEGAAVTRGEAVNNFARQLEAATQEYNMAMEGRKTRLSDAQKLQATQDKILAEAYGKMGKSMSNINKKQADNFAKVTNDSRGQKVLNKMYTQAQKQAFKNPPKAPKKAAVLWADGSVDEGTQALKSFQVSSPKIAGSRPNANLTSNKRIVNNFKSMGRGIDVSTLMGKTVQQYQQEAIKAFAEREIALTFKGNKATFQAKGQEPVTIELAELADGNTITKGGQKYANRAFADTDWSLDSKGNIQGKNILIDAWGAQYKNLANMATKYEYDDKGEIIQTIDGALTQALKSGKADVAKSIGKGVVDRAIGKAPANLSHSVAKEINEDALANKTNEQAYVQRGMFNMNKKWEDFIRNDNNIEFFQKYLDNQSTKSPNLKNREVPIPNQLLEGINLLYDLMSRGDSFAQEEISKLSDNHLSKILYNGMQKDGQYKVSFTDKEGNQQNFDTKLQYMFNAMRDYIGAGLVPVFDSMKEEGVIAGDKTVASANDLNGFGFVKNSSSRAQHQTNNYMRRAYEPEMGSKSIFGSRAARVNGIDNNAAERTLYSGGMASDLEIMNAINAINERTPGMISEELARVMSTYEGGMLVGSDFAKELTGYLEQQKEAYDEDINLDSLKKLGVTMDEINALQKGEMIPLSQIVKGEGFEFSKDAKLKAGDRITGLQKTEEGLKLRYDEMTQVKTGSKLLLGNSGGRQTARVVPQEIMDAVATELGMKGANFITEHKHDTTKGGQFDFTGRINEMVANAQEQGLTNQQILEAFKGTQYEKAMIMNELGQIESTIFTDEASGKTLYEDQQTGAIKSFWDYDENGNADMGQVARSIIEDLSGLVGSIDGIVEGTQSDMQIFEENLAKIGGENFQKSNPKLFKDYANLAKQYDYSNPVGSGNNNVLEDKGRAQFSSKARIANENVIATGKLKYQDDAKALAELDAFLKAEKKSTDRVGKDREKAIINRNKIIDALDRSFTHNEYGYTGDAKFSFSGNNKEGAISENKTLKVSVNSNGQITFNGAPQKDIVTHLEYDEEGNTGYSTKDYNNSLIARAKKYMEENHLHQMVVENGDKKMIMPTIEDTQLHNGNMLISRTSGALHGMFKQGEDGSFTMTADFSSVRDNLAKYATDKHSKLVEAADKSFIANSTWGELTGTNTADKATNIADANNIYITEDKLKAMMTAEQTATREDVLANVEQLLMQKYSQEGSYEETQQMLAAEFQKLAELDQSQLRDYESTVINDLVSGVKDGSKELNAQFTRFPLTSGQDIRYSKLKINNSIGNDAGILISRGLADTVNGDYDGDHTTLRLLGLDYAQDYKEYYDAQMGANKLVDMHTEVARNMENRHGEDKLEDPHSAKKQYEMVKDMSNRKNDQAAGMMSKYNKKYVGMFSNISTSLRNFMRAFDADEVGAVNHGGMSKEEITYAGVLRSFTEMFEQDSISAKKVFQRMFEGGNYEMDELQGIYDAMREGNFGKVIQDAMDKGILKTKEDGSIDTRQWDFQKNTLKAAGIDMNEVFKGKSDIDILEQALRYAVSLGETNGLEAKKMTGLSHGKYVQNKGAQARLVKAKQKEREALRSQSNAKLDTTTGDIQKDVQNALEIAQEAKSTADEAKAEAGEAKEEAEEPPSEESGYRALKTTNAKDYETSHTRLLSEWNGQGEVRKSGGGHGVTASQIDNITGYAIKKADQSKWGHMETTQPWAEAASALGTYGHKVAELINKHQVEHLEELDGVLTQEEVKELTYAKNNALSQYGMVSNEDISKYARGAEQLVNAGRMVAPELFGKNAKTEYAMGGVFTRDGKQRTFSGEADVMARKDDGSGYSMGDYKFSEKNDPQTIAKRIMQQSIYLAMYEKELEAKLKAIGEGVDVGEDPAELQAELNAIKNGNKNGANTANIFRRNKEGLIEVISAQMLNTEEVLHMADMSTEYVELQNLIEAETAKFGSYESLQRAKEKGVDGALQSFEKIQTALARQQVLRSSGLMQNVYEQLAKSGIIKDENGQLIDKDGFIGGLFKDYNSASSTFGTVEGGIQSKKKQPSNNKDVTRYLEYARRASQLEQDIAKRQVLVDQSSGSEKRQHQEVLRSAQQQLAVMQSKLALYNRQEGTLNGIKLSEKDIERLESRTMLIQQRKEMALGKIGAQMKMEQGLLDKMLNGFKQQFSNFLGMNLTYQLVGEIRQLFGEIVQLTQQLDANMVDLQIASGGTREEVEGMVKGFNDLAMKTGRSTSEVATAANDWIRAGYKGDDATKLTEASMQLSTLGMMEASDATTALISSLKGWKLSAEDVAGVVDKLVTLDMSYAISAGDLAEAMARANNSARVAGSSLDNFMSYITVGADVTQRAPESIGEAWKTLYSRLGNVKAGKFVASAEDIAADDYNEGDWEQLNDVEKVLNGFGIALRDTAGTFKDADEIISELGENWQTYNSVQKNAIATAVAGTRQREVFYSTMENWEQVGKAARIAADSQGNAAQKMDAYTDSVQAAKNRITAAVEKLTMNLNLEGIIKTFYKVTAGLIDNIGLVSTAVAGFLLATKGKSLMSAIFGDGKFLNNAMYKMMGTGLGTNNQGSIFSAFKDQYGDGQWKKNLNEMANLQHITAIEKQIANGSQTSSAAVNSFLNLGTNTFGDAKVQSAISKYVLRLDENGALLQMEAKDRVQLLTQITESITTGEKNMLAETILSEEEMKQAEEIAKGTINAMDLSNATAEEVEEIKEAAIANEKVNIALNKYAEVLSGATEEERRMIANFYKRQSDPNLGSKAFAQGALTTGFTTAGAIAPMMLSKGSGALFGALGMDEGTSSIVSMLGMSALGNAAGKNAKGIMEGAKAFSAAAKSAQVASTTLNGTGGLIGAFTSMSTAMKAGATEMMAVEGAMMGLASAGLLIAGIIAMAAMQAHEKAKEARAEAYTDAKAEYDKIIDATATFDESRYSYLAAGVDKYGNNVSLGDDEYSEFVETSNRLAEVFPDLVTYTDEAGNKFLNLGESAKEMSNAIDQATASAQRARDEALLRTRDDEISNLKDQEREIRKKYMEIARERGGRGSDLSTLTSQERSAMNKEIQDLYAGESDYFIAQVREAMGQDDEGNNIYDQLEPAIQSAIQNVASSGLIDFTAADWENQVAAVGATLASMTTDQMEILTNPEKSKTAGDFSAARTQLSGSMLEQYGDPAEWADWQIANAKAFGFD